MKLLIAEDDNVFCRLLQDFLEPEYDAVIAHDGDQAWRLLQGSDRPRLAVLDWMMPGLEGPAICRKVRATYRASSPATWIRYNIAQLRSSASRVTPAGC